MEIKNLNNPPIKEALLEIRFNPNKDVTIERLEQFVDSLSDEYPNREPVKNQTIEVKFSAEGEPEHNVNVQPGGFKISNTQKNRIIIATIDKLVVSFLPPYKPWPELRDRTTFFYQQLMQFVPQSQIIRLGMRFINEIKLPLKEGFSFQNYTTTFQPLPKYVGIPSTLSKYESTISIPFADIECESTIRQMMFEADEDKGELLTFMLDIDIYQAHKYEAENAGGIWDVFDNMQQKRNAIFFGSLTDEALAQYE